MSEDMENKNIVVCTDCAATCKANPTKAGNLRLPTGWKRVGEELLCKECKAKRMRLRAVTFPVATVIGAEWKEFTAALKICWGRSTRLANWTVRQLLNLDVDRKATDSRLAKAPRYELYRLWTDTYHDREAWAGSAQSANCILRSIEQKHRKKRYDMLWLNAERPPRMTYPVPFPVHNASWKAEYHETTGDDGQVMKVPIVNVNLDGKTFCIKLRGGHERARQLKAFAQLASGEAVRGELAVYRVRSFAAHRRTVSETAPGRGGETVKSRIMVKMVAHLPAPRIERKGKGILDVRTGRKALIVATVPGRETPWLYHCFNLKREMYAYDARRQRIADDLKAERRPATPTTADRLKRAALHMNRRIDSDCRLIARMVAQYASRQGLAEVRYNDDERRYFERFDWGKLTLYLAEACEDLGLKFTDASGDMIEDENTQESSLNGDTTNI